MQQLIEQLALDEGLRLKPYKCTTGKLTIGYGRNLDDRGISADEAKHLLQNDIIHSLINVRGSIDTFDKLNEVRQNVLINMCFNLGLLRFCGFKKMLKAVAEEDFKRVSEEMLDSKWASQVGKRAERLANEMRRGTKQC